MEPLYSTLGGDPDLGDLVTLFVDEMADRVTNILDLFNRHQWEELRRDRTSNKGSGGQLWVWTHFALRRQTRIRHPRQRTRRKYPPGRGRSGDYVQSCLRGHSADLGFRVRGAIFQVA